MPYVDYSDGKYSKELWVLDLPTMWYYGEGAISDETNSYRFNTLGYRDDEFSKVDMLISGCSVTFGEGIPEQWRWGDVLADKLGIKSKANIGHRGGSIYSTILYSMAYIKKYGKPKYIFCMFPDLSRYNIPIVDTIASSYASPSEVKTHGTIVNIPIKNLYDSFETPKYMKIPYNLSDIFPVDVGVYQGTMQIQMFSMYCKAEGIKFLWSTWDKHFNSAIHPFKNEYPEYVDYINDYVPEKTDCHQDLLDTYGLNFYRGLDNLDKEIGYHQGIHDHVHMAESFYKALN
jgi:hypothetical protein